MGNKKELFEEIRQIISDVDPVGISNVTPDDEFDNEISRLISFLDNANNASDFERQTFDLFREQFEDNNFDKIKLAQMARKIWLLKNSQ